MAFSITSTLKATMGNALDGTMVQMFLVASGGGQYGATATACSFTYNGTTNQLELDNPVQITVNTPASPPLTLTGALIKDGTGTELLKETAAFSFEFTNEGYVTIESWVIDLVANQ